MTGTQVSARLRIRVDWWVLVAAGAVWLVFGMVVLQFDLVSAWSLRLSAGLLLVIAAFSQLLNAQAAPRWRWLYAALAGSFFVIGMTALVWPDPTYLALTRIVAWFLLFKGGTEVFVSLADRTEDALWWLLTVVGLLEIAVGFAVAGVPAQSIPLLALWVGLIALSTGVTDVVQGFAVRSWPAERLTSSVSGGAAGVDPAQRGSSGEAGPPATREM